MARKLIKEHRRTIRLSDADLKSINQKMTEINVSSFTEFATNCMLNRSLTKPIRSELMAELHRIGNNLNQIAKKLNSGEVLDKIGLAIISDTNDIMNDIYKELAK